MDAGTGKYKNHMMFKTAFKGSFPYRVVPLLLVPPHTHQVIKVTQKKILVVFSNSYPGLVMLF